MNQNLEVQRNKTLKYLTDRIKPGALMIAVITFVACYLMTLASVTPRRYEIREGDIAAATITAPRDVEDSVTTQEMQDKAMEAVRPIYKQAKESTEASLESIKSYFASAESIRSYCETLYINDMLKSINSNSPVESTNFDPEDVKWKKFLTDDKLADVKNNVKSDFTGDEVILIASIKKEALADLDKYMLKIAQDELDIGIKEENLNEQLLRLTAQIMTNASYSETQRKIAVKALALIKPNMVYDETATNAEKKLAADNVLPTVYKKGQNIVQVGEAVTKAQIQVLKDLSLIQDNTFNFNLYLGVFIYLFICFALYCAYTVVFNRDMLRSIKYVILTAIIVWSCSALAIPLNQLEPRIITVFFGTILTCILISPKSAVGVAFLLSFITGLTSASGEGIISDRMLMTILCGISGGLTAVFFLRRAHHRTEYIYSGFAAGLVNFMALVMAALIQSTGLKEIWQDGMWAMVNGIGSAILSIGALPILESVFRIATATKLLEILNPNQPLLRRLSLETPGTYHHSMIAANLAEAAADELSLNTLLVKASAYYHDVGKLKKPEMFKENQQGRDNPHDLMEPKKSAHVLREHVTYGKYLAIKNKLPKDIVDMMEQHHGTTVMVFFYCKAREMYGTASMEDFRYKGPKPQIKEAAIIMLADSVEAAVRASGLVQIEKIREIIEKLIKERVEDGQFEECDITQRDLARIVNAFISVYQGMFHERIKYPGVEVDAESHN